MRTTVDIPDATYRKLKVQAARRGCSVKALILSAVQRDLQATPKKRRIKLPIESKEPGSLDLTNEQIYELIGFP